MSMQSHLHNLYRFVSFNADLSENCNAIKIEFNYDVWFIV